ncbi:MAG TPA: hypothetical protein VES95_11225 [Dermatophilaceae bacterium]|nr:hypothetical protein [Dermatophilaceae bacterium]
MDTPQPPAPGEASTRAARRAQREALNRPLLPDLATERRVPMVLATWAAALLVALGAAAGPALCAAVVGWAGLVVAWGWPRLLGSPSRVGSSSAIAVAAVSAALVVALSDREPYLAYLPAAVAAGLLAMILHQLLRRDGRPRLTESLAVSAAGVTVVTVGVLYVPLARSTEHLEVVLAATAAVAAGALADLLAPFPRVRPWLMPIAMVLGGAAAAAVAGAGEGVPVWREGLLIGVLCAAVGHALRRVLSTLPPVTALRSQASAGTASVLLPAVVAYVLAVVLLR